MGYLRNHLATVITGIFAAVLTGLWPYFIDFAPDMNIIFIISVPITWFLTLMCWLTQKSTDYIHKQSSVQTDIQKSTDYIHKQLSAHTDTKKKLE